MPLSFDQVNAELNDFANYKLTTTSGVIDYTNPNSRDSDADGNSGVIGQRIFKGSDGNAYVDGKLIEQITPDVYGGGKRYLTFQSHRHLVRADKKGSFIQTTRYGRLSLAKARQLSKA